MQERQAHTGGDGAFQPNGAFCPRPVLLAEKAAACSLPTRTPHRITQTVSLILALVGLVLFPVQETAEMGMLKEFKEFAMRGNVVDMAVGLVVGASFGKIVTSLVNDVIMPPIGRLMGNMDFAQLHIKLGQATKTVVVDGKPTQVVEDIMLKYGAFINTLLDFIIVAFCLFLVVKAMNTLKRKKEEAPAAPPEPPADVKLLTEIRDLLKAGK